MDTERQRTDPIIRRSTLPVDVLAVSYLTYCASIAENHGKPSGNDSGKKLHCSVKLAETKQCERDREDIFISASSLLLSTKMFRRCDSFRPSLADYV